MKLTSKSMTESRSATPQVALSGRRDEAIVIPGACCCTAAIVR